MDSRNPSYCYDPLDLEILDRVYEAARAQVEARNLYRSPGPDGRREEALRKVVFSVAGTHPVDFDTICDQVVASLNLRLAG